MHLILTGATGLVGSAALDAMLHTPTISKITILSRRPIPFAQEASDPRVNVILHQNFNQYDPSLLEQLQGANGCVWALGISQNLVSAEDYVEITKDYALSAARVFEDIKASEGKFRMVYVSGEGTTHNPGRFTPIFGRVKGETEKELAVISARGHIQIDSVRPSFVDKQGHEAILPYVPAVPFSMKAMVAVAGPLIRGFMPSQHSPTPMLGRGLVDMAMGKMEGKFEGKGVERVGGSWIVSNVGFRRMVGA
ncbi:uncharacterized protein J7T54_007183 [Emericellopsis cladophorae]|uniref:Nucleoside-diphosphate-sugar epimerase n=1 Tax=Emericellopsis cladophorae TaxID=2686198 RepID=A0A9Q0BI74_9HYPO|nr:uncharacterized protein J7T54_007183 [Emericellopsis cladophorae]KAI6785540.1 hypothetical protein J7T54_007183 [Emericellopsis cladophorae]